MAIALVASLPVLSLLWTALQGDGAHWQHLARYVLPDALRTTAWLLAGVGAVVLVIGAGTAWLVSAYDFPGRRVLAWALLLPLAMPTYVVAFAWLDLLHPLGPLQGGLRALLGVDSPRDFRLPDLRSLPGCIALLGLVLYPYVYLTARAMFATQAAVLVEAARTLGVGGWGLFRRVAMPLARPALAAGMALALLEALNDIGASEFLGVRTLTVTVYTTWVTRSDLPAAAQIASAMLLLVIALLAFERYGRRRRGYAAMRRPRPIQPVRLRGLPALLAFAACTLPVALGFVAPAGFLLVEAVQRMQGAGISPQLLAALRGTLWVATLATLLTMAAGLVLAWALRLAQARRRGRFAALAQRVGALGYAIPGTVLAIALLHPLAWMDSGVGALAHLAGGGTGPWVMGTLAALVLAYALRFLAIAAGGLESGLSRVPASLDSAARVLGAGSTRMLARVHAPLLRPAFAAAALLVFVDAMKELPATLLLRPPGFETLATWLYAEAARGTYEEGAVAALLIVLAGLLPVVLLARGGAPAQSMGDAVAPTHAPEAR